MKLVITLKKSGEPFNYSRESSRDTKFKYVWFARRRADGTGNEFLSHFQLDTLAVIINFVVVRLYWRFGRLGN